MTGFAQALRREIDFLRANPWDLGLLILFPAILLITIGALFQAGTPRDAPIAIVDQDNSALSRALVRDVEAAPGVRIAARPADLEAAWPLVRAGDVAGVLFIPHDFSRDASARGGARALLYYNAAFTTLAGVLQRDVGAAVAALNARVLRSDVARTAPSSLRPLPVRVQSTTLYNAYGSYEWLLAGAGQPATLAILITCAIIAAIGREFAAKTAPDWLGARGGVLAPLAGKATPYVIVFFVFGAACIIWLAGVRGFRVAGSAALLATGLALVLIAYASLAALVIAALKDSVTAFGIGGLYASSALAYSGATFPTDGAPWLARAWSNLQPLTWYLRVQAEQWQAGADWRATLPELGVLALYSVIALPLAILLLRRARAT